MVPSEDTWHVSRVHKRVLKFSQLWSLKSSISNCSSKIHSRVQKHWEYVESVVEQFKKLGISFRTPVLSMSLNWINWGLVWIEQHKLFHCGQESNLLTSHQHQVGSDWSLARMLGSYWLRLVQVSADCHAGQIGMNESWFEFGDKWTADTSLAPARIMKWKWKCENKNIY